MLILFLVGIPIFSSFTSSRKKSDCFGFKILRFQAITFYYKNLSILRIGYTISLCVLEKKKCIGTNSSIK